MDELIKELHAIDPAIATEKRGEDLLVHSVKSPFLVTPDVLERVSAADTAKRLAAMIDLDKRIAAARP